MTDITRNLLRKIIKYEVRTLMTDPIKSDYYIGSQEQTEIQNLISSEFKLEIEDKETILEFYQRILINK
jgi:hypothetical protein|tara:strand:+ start:119 stop:325 length:207 start_codon:yes stop_codon:yes gene_type:complete